MISKSTLIKLTEIIIDNTIYPRAAFDPNTVDRYREALEAGETLPPLVVMSDGRLLDGLHRYEAHKQAGVKEVVVIIEDPEDPDARAIELNLRHGKPLTREELKEAARRWYGKKQVTEIAKTLGVTRQTVQNWVADLAEEREEERAEIREKALEMRAKGLTQEEVAKTLGIDRTTVSKWEKSPCERVKNLTLSHSQEDYLNPPDDENISYQSTDENNQEQEFNETDKVQDSAQLKAIIGCHIETHYGTGGIVTDVSGPYENGFYTITYKHPRDGKKCWINSITVKENNVLCEGVPLKILTDPDAVANKKEKAHVFKEEDQGREKETEPQKSRQAAEAERKKLLPYSDMVKEFYQQLKKTSELAEQLINRREDLIETIAGMEADGMSITVLANAVIQACEIYFPRMSEARDMLEEVIKSGIKGAVVKDKFVVVQGGKRDEG